MDQESVLHLVPWPEEAHQHPTPAARPERPARTRRRRFHGRRVHRFRHYKPSPRAVDRVRTRRRHEHRVHAALRLFSVPVLALVPASMLFIEYPLNLAIAPALGVMGLVLMFGRQR